MAAPFERSAWAKTVTLDDGTESLYPLIDHLLDTAAVAMLLWDRYLTTSQRLVISDGLKVGAECARRLVAFWAGLHDIGKLTPDFQHCHDGGWRQLAPQLRADVGDYRHVRHDLAGLRAAPAFLRDLGYDFGEEGAYGGSAGWALAQIIGGHHGLFNTAQFEGDCVGLYALDEFGGDTWREQRAIHARTVHAVLGSPAAPEHVAAPVAVLITGLIILADWLVSQEHFLRLRIEAGSQPPEKHFATAVEAGVGLLREAGLDAADLAWKPVDFAAQFGIKEPNPLQRALLGELPGAVRGPGILVATMLMGDGKTELALAAQRVISSATGADGFFLALPTMATSDQMYLRARRYAERATTGPSAVSLAHSMAWLNPAYGLASGTGPDSEVITTDTQHTARTAAPQWLHGSKRPLLARIASGTIDQALAAVLPMRHNALRLLALSGRTLIVDEAHAYDPYMQALLERLLTWLARYGTSVVLLSATLPGSTVDRLVRAYLRGAGWKNRNKQRPGRQLPPEPYRVAYPGWIYVGADSATITAAPNPRVCAEHASLRRVELALETRYVRHGSPQPGHTHAPAERLARIDDALRPLIAQGGTAAVVCTTVDEAQATYDHLRAVTFKDRPASELILLHARYPAEVREARTEAIVAALGRGGPRPDRLVLVATAIIEQSLDLDVDVLISDLAPISLLLQRAGRCWRHERYWQALGDARPRKRPAWCGCGPRLITLVPVDERGRLSVPARWGYVYHPYLLAETAEALAELAGKNLVLPDAVQALVERVYGKASAFLREVAAVTGPQAESAWRASKSAWDGEQLAQRQMADCVKIPGPHDVTDLSALSARDFPDAEVGTRLGADSVRVLPCFAQAGGRLTLDPDGKQELPGPAPGQRRMGRDQIRAVMAKTIPCAERYLKGRGADTNPPASWEREPWLSELMLLPHRQAADGRWIGTRVGARVLTLDHDLGLVIDG